MKQVLNVLMLFLFLVACNKQELTTNLSDSDKILNVDGFITDKNEIQYIQFNWSSNLGDDSPDYADDVSLQLMGEDEVYSFTHDFQGRYRSVNAFEGVPGQEYEFQFAQEGNLHAVRTKMPFPMVLDSAFIDSELEFFNLVSDVRLQIDSEREQYLGYDIYEMDTISPFSGDTVWTEIPTPIFLVTPVQAAPNQIIRLPVNSSTDLLDGEKKVKVKVYSISQDVGDYLLELADYMNSGQANSQFFNPPSFFSEKIYGMAYGRTESTIVFTP